MGFTTSNVTPVHDWCGSCSGTVAFTWSTKEQIYRCSNCGKQRLITREEYEDAMQKSADEEDYWERSNQLDRDYYGGLR